MTPLFSNLSFRKSFFLLAVAAITSACSHATQITQHAGHYNDTLASVEDEMMLKNILRAAKRRKMHFTRLQSFSGAMRSQVSVNANLRAGADGATEAFFSPLSALTYSSPSYAMTALNSKSFFNGIMAPVTPTTFDLFADQGWDIAILMSIFIESVTVTSDNEKAKDFRCTIENDPEKDMQRFTEFVRIASRVIRRENIDEETNPFGPPIPASNIQSGQELEALKNTGLTLKKVSASTYQLQDPTSKRAYVVDTVGLPVDLLISLDAEGQACSLQNISALLPAGYTVDATKAKADQGRVKLRAEAKLRSAQGMIFYLGELSRFDIRNPDAVPGEGQNVGPNKYWSITDTPEFGSALSARVQGLGYISIPDGTEYTESTLRMMTLVQQVFDLNTASDEAPKVTPVIRVVN